LNSNKPNTKTKSSGGISEANCNPNFNFKPTNKNINMNSNNYMEDTRSVKGGNVKNRLMEQQMNNFVVYPCKLCGRKFVEESLAKHQNVCKKVFFSKRKGFDATKKRIIDSEHAMLMKYSNKNDKYYQTSTKKRNWKKESEQFRTGLKLARQYEQKNNIDSKTFSLGSSKYGTTSSYSQYQTRGKNQGGGGSLKFCHYCNKNISSNGFLKHVSFCEYRDRGLNMKVLYGGGGKKLKYSGVGFSTPSTKNPKLYTNSTVTINLKNSKIDNFSNMDNMMIMNNKNSINNKKTSNIDSITTSMNSKNINMNSMNSNSNNNKYKIINSNVSSFKF